MLDPDVVDQVRRRSRDRCEASDGRRCRRPAVAFHHRLPKGRGGRLDETPFNLAHVCRACHDAAHGGRPLVMWNGSGPVLVRGWLETRLDGTVRYRGGDAAYLHHYH